MTSQSKPTILDDVRNHSRDTIMADEKEFKLTPKAKQLLEALRKADDWTNRTALATAIEKKSLNKWDVILLDKMDTAGLIEIRKIDHHGPIGYEWQYRFAQDNE